MAAASLVEVLSMLALALLYQSVLHGDCKAAEAAAAQAEQICVPLRASAVLAATQLARGLACLGAGRPADAAQIPGLASVT